MPEEEEEEKSRVGPEGWSCEGWGLERWGVQFSRFFPSPGGFEAAGASHDSPRTLNAHI